MDNYEKAVLFICNFKVRGMLYEQAKECALIAIDEKINLFRETILDFHLDENQKALDKYKELKVIKTKIRNL